MSAIVESRPHRNLVGVDFLLCLRARDGRCSDPDRERVGDETGDAGDDHRVMRRASRTPPITPATGGVRRETVVESVHHVAQESARRKPARATGSPALSRNRIERRGVFGRSRGPASTTPRRPRRALRRAPMHVEIPLYSRDPSSASNIGKPEAGPGASLREHGESNRVRVLGLERAAARDCAPGAVRPTPGHDGLRHSASRRYRSLFLSDPAPASRREAPIRERRIGFVSLPVMLEDLWRGRRGAA